MLDRLKAFLAPPETKASRTAKLLAFESGGRARWTPRDYAALAREGYLRNAIVHRAVRLIAENVASCSYLVFDGAQEREAHPLSLLLTRPNARQDGGAFLEMLVSHLLLSGNAYIEAVALDGAVRELHALRPDRMKVVPGSDGWAEAYEYSVAGRSVRFDQGASPVAPILHLTFFHPLDDHYGLAPIEPAAVAIDAAIQIGVLDLTLTAPPSSPTEGERHVVASGATGAWAGQDNAIATWQDGAWAFLAPKIGWCIWSVADDVMFVFDGTTWRDFRSLPSALDNALRVGVNTAASSPNLLAIKSNAALFAAIDAADGGTGDMRLQVSKESSADTASVVFSDNFSGRAEFGLVGADTFKLKVSADGSAWTEAFNIDQGSGNLTLPRGLALTGVIAPAQITADQNDYNPVGLATAAVMQVSADAARSISGLAGGTEGRCVTVINVGSQPMTLLNESTSSSASNRFTLNGSLTISAQQAVILRYDGTAARWQAIAGGAGLVPANNLSDLASVDAARNNLGIIPSLQNALINGAMDIWQRGTSSSCPSGTRTFLADRWFVNPAGAAVTASRATLLPSSPRSRYSLQILGAASATTVNAGQRIEASNIPQIKGTVIFQAQIYNGTGSNFTPTLLLGTPAAADDFTTVTNRLTQTLQACASGGYTQVSFSVDISGYANIDNGLQAELQFPSGSLNSGSKDVKITEVALQLGRLPTPFERPPISMTLGLCLPYFQKSFSYLTAPAQNLGNLAGSIVTVTAGTNAGAGAESVKFLPPLRALPTLTTYNPKGSDANWWDANANASRTVGAADLTEKGFRCTVNATTTAAAQHFIQWSADAEL